jgi:hypothetical protein
MSSDLVKRLDQALHFEDWMPVPDNFSESVPLLRESRNRIEELEAKLELIQEEWAGVVYGDLENGVASLNAAAATDFHRRYPLVASFGETLNRIVDGKD